VAFGLTMPAAVAAETAPAGQEAAPKQ